MKQFYCDELIQKLQLIKENRCFLSEDDKKVLEEVIQLLKQLIIEVNEKQTDGCEKAAKVLELLLKLFLLGNEITDILKNLS